MLKLRLYSFFYCYFLMTSLHAIDSYDQVLMIYADKGQQVTFNELKTLANQGDAEGQYQLGQRYLLGEVIKQDIPQAVIWLEKAAQQDYTAAMMTLRQLYSSGLGVSINMEKAIFWLERSEKLTIERAKIAHEILDSDCE